MASALQKDDPAPALAEIIDETVIGQQLTELPADVLVRILRTLHTDLLKKALVPPGEKSSAGENNRRHARQRTLRTAKIIYHNHTCVADCQIRDMSQSGCRIRVASAANMPRHFELKIVGVTEARFCEVKWRSPEELGVHFIN